MDIAALLTSAGINIAVCVVLFSLYSILRKQPSNVNVYFGRRLASRRSQSNDLCLDRFVPSPKWAMRAWEMTQEEMLTIGGLDAVVFSRMVVFSIRVFSVAAVVCTVLVLPVNYYGRDRIHKNIPLESLEVFTIENVKEGSQCRYAALTVAQSLQTSNPMLWVTDLAPEPQDVYWPNLCIPYKQLWIRKITTFAASATFVFVFLIPVTFAQGLTQLDKLEKMFPFLAGMLQKFILGYDEDAMNSSYTFPYHTEVPRILLFGFLGFTCSILAPLILPFLLFYFVLAYLVYRNQLWPIAHNTAVLSLLVAQVIALGVFGLKESPVASGFTIPLLICTVLFHQYCRQRFLPVFKNNATQVLIDMDRRDERCGTMDQIYEQVNAAYCQFSSSTQSECFGSQGEGELVRTPKDLETGNKIGQQDDIIATDTWRK
ncbi:unnamed protein product [Sphenostylis stenocarpa]|uniref:CSC1-like protein RXW8 n=1 Tax=Sphenostylis stenocarpa TaxID=92480 RepID=A0AA86T3T3_9FABA|nr:unnamed protein product [Sphenostylis stenocarpa]